MSMKDIIFLVGFTILFVTMTGGMWLYLENPFVRKRKKLRAIELPPREHDTLSEGAQPQRIPSGLSR